MAKLKDARASAVLKIGFDKHPDYSQIESSVKALDGVSRAEINPVTGMIKVEYDPTKLTLEAIQRILRP